MNEAAQKRSADRIAVAEGQAEHAGHRAVVDAVHREAHRTSGVRPLADDRDTVRDVVKGRRGYRGRVEIRPRSGVLLVDGIGPAVIAPVGVNVKMCVSRESAVDVAVPVALVAGLKWRGGGRGGGGGSPGGGAHRCE